MNVPRVVLDRRTRVLRREGVVRVLGGDPVTLVTPTASAAALLAGVGRRRRSIPTDTPAGAALARALTDRGMAHPDVSGAAPASHPPAPASHSSAPAPTAPGPARPRTAPDAVAVVVPVRDDADGVAALAHALAPDIAGGVRLVVVDDGSAVPLAAPGPPTTPVSATPPVFAMPLASARTPEPATAPAAAPPPAPVPPPSASDGAGSVRVVRHERSRGPAAARNTGTAVALAAGARVVVYLDADVVPRPGWLEPLLAHLDDPRVAAVAPRIVAAEPGRFWVRGYETARSALDMGPEPARVRPRTRVAYVPSAALAVRPDRLPAAPGGAGQGPFDERMHVAEDVDLCWRTDEAGGLIRYEPASRVAHRHRTSVVPLLTRREFYGRGAAPLADRHGAHVAPAVAAPWSLAVALGVWSATPAGLLVAGAAAARAWRRTRALTGDGRSAAELVARGAGASVRQLPEALLRPYWPVTAAVLAVTAPSQAPLARALRRRVMAAALAEALWHWWSAREPGHLPVDEPLGHVVLHRLDDLAYGVGVWRSALRARSFAGLRPELKR